jgi:hypothetical protein
MHENIQVGSTVKFKDSDDLFFVTAICKEKVDSKYYGLVPIRKAPLIYLIVNKNDMGDWDSVIPTDIDFVENNPKSYDKFVDDWEKEEKEADKDADSEP